MKRKVNIIPLRTVPPLMIMVLLHGAAFYGTRLITADMKHHDIALSADYMLPLIPAFIAIYVLAYIQWAAGYLLLCRGDRELFSEMLAGNIITKIICIVIFIVLPTAMVRPEVTGSGIFNGMVRLIYSLDTPDNLFPSLHCVESWFTFRCALKMRKPGRWYTVVSFVFTLLVFASVVFVKQHRLADIAGGILVLEAGMFISKKIGAGRLLERLCRVRVGGSPGNGPASN